MRFNGFSKMLFTIKLIFLFMIFNIQHHKIWKNNRNYNETDHKRYYMLQLYLFPMSLVICSFLCAFLAQYTPGLSWPDNRSWIITAIIGFYFSQLLHLLFFICREGIFFLETNPKPINSIHNNSNNNNDTSSASESKIVNLSGVRLSSECERYSTKYVKFGLFGNFW